MGGLGPLRERGGALELAAAEADRARSGTGRLLLLQGATGTGRTALLEAVAAQAEARGTLVLRARCSPDELTVPFAAAHRLLSCAPGPTGDIEPFPDGDDGGDEAGAPRARAYAATLWQRLRAYADEGPLLVAVDDVHFADEPSRRWLVETVRRIDRLPVLLVATERSQYDIGQPPAGLAHSLSPTLVRTHT
ncbi:ATP-binding protein, partial [Streptomyces sp. NPDC059786]